MQSRVNVGRKKNTNNTNNGRKKSYQATQNKAAPSGSQLGRTSGLPGLSKEILDVVPRLSKCAAEYACALEDPFNCNGLACIPDFPAIPSRKMVVFIKSVMTIGTLGLGYSVASPYNGVANNLGVLTSTTAAYASTFIDPTLPGTLTQSSNSDYLGTAIGGGLGMMQYRMVGGGIRIKYTGTELNRSGMVFHLEEPNHGSLTSPTAIVANIEAYDCCLKTPVQRNWHTVVTHPVHRNEIDYAFQVPGTTPAVPGNANMIGLIVTSLPGNTFDVEYYALFELTGSSVRGKTPSDVDRTGMDAVLSTTQGNLKSGYVGEPKHDGIIERVWQTLVKGVSGIASLAWENRGTIMNSALKAMQLL
jgi:hypothetical protein